MPFAYPFAGLATGLAILIFVWTGFVVGKARKQHNVPHPETQGSPGFNRAWRAHQNTLEALPIFIPALWLFALTFSDAWAGILGLVWAVGRVVYVRGYCAAAEKREAGFTIAILANAVLLFGAMGKIAYQLFT